MLFQGHTDKIRSVAWSRDGKRLVSAGLDNTVKIWDATSKPETYKNDGKLQEHPQVKFSPDGNRLATAGGADFAVVRDIISGEKLFTLQGDPWWAYSVAFSPDGKRLASASNDSTVRVWDSESGQQTLSLRGHRGEISSVAFSPDGLQLASVGGGELRIWDARPWTPELKAQEEAMSLIRFHRTRPVLDDNANDIFVTHPVPSPLPQPLAGAALRKAISEERTISETVRQRALDMIRD
jgi:WD40 repeat protein